MLLLGLAWGMDFILRFICEIGSPMVTRASINKNSVKPGVSLPAVTMLCYWNHSYGN